MRGDRDVGCDGADCGAAAVSFCGGRVCPRAPRAAQPRADVRTAVYVRGRQTVSVTGQTANTLAVGAVRSVPHALDSDAVAKGSHRHIRTSTAVSR